LPEPSGARFWLTLCLSVVAIFVLLDRIAVAFGSLRGEAGVPVAGLTLFACLFAERVLWGRRGTDAVRRLGLGMPTGRALIVASVIGFLLLLVIPAFAATLHADLTMYPRWWSLLPGLYAQGGVAEEVLFRGYLFGTLRRRYAFGPAAAFSTGPFLAAHLLLFATMSWPVALAATMLSLVVSFPLARLFDLGGGTIWAPALLHFFIQSPIKIVQMSGPLNTVYPMVWMTACALVPWLVFAVRVPGPSARVLTAPAAV
jgi:membrane protease YdiL (CAAX protease family)